MVKYTVSAFYNYTGKGSQGQIRVFNASTESLVSERP